MLVQNGSNFNYSLPVTILNISVQEIKTSFSHRFSSQKRWWHSSLSSCIAMIPALCPTAGGWAAALLLQRYLESLNQDMVDSPSPKVFGNLFQWLRTFYLTSSMTTSSANFQMLDLLMPLPSRVNIPLTLAPVWILLDQSSHLTRLLNNLCTLSFSKSLI